MTGAKKGGGINISMNGGGQIGAVNQGDNARITSNLTATGGGVSAEEVQALRTELEALAEVSEVSFAEMRKVQAKLAEMETLAEEGGTVEKIASVAKSIHDNFGWTMKPLGAFIAAII
jgi:hypothetical protein